MESQIFGRKLKKQTGSVGKQYQILDNVFISKEDNINDLNE